jgi:site-specific DNA-methyltransferase (adenine-specific)
MISEVFNEDCEIGMKRYPDKFFDLAIVDPPYGIGEDGSRNHSRSKKKNFGAKNTKNTIVVAKDYKSYSGGDKEAPGDDYWIELVRVSKNQIVWGANHFISKIPFDSSCWIVWDKVNGESDFADCELAWTSFKTAVRKFEFRWLGMLQDDMKNKEERIHPNHKPIKLYKWLLKNYANPGDKILDTHGGSFSSRIASYDMGFDFTGFELDRDYFNASEKRFNQHKAQLNLFK